MEEERRQILTQVASGTLTPEEAAAKLDELEAGAPAAATAVADSPPVPTTALKTVAVNIAIGHVIVTGDPSVNEVVADGDHTVTREGDRVVIEGDALPMSSNTFAFGNSRVGWLNGNPWKKPLLVRMNPALALEVSVQGGKASVRGVRGPIKAGVQAGAVDVEGFEAPFDFSTEAGAVRASGRLVSGNSRIRCAAGGVKLNLEQGSSVRVTAHSDLGQVRLDGAGWRTESQAGKNRETAVLGGGVASLDVECTVGSVRLDAL